MSSGVGQVVETDKRKFRKENAIKWSQTYKLMVTNMLRLGLLYFRTAGVLRDRCRKKTTCNTPPAILRTSKSSNGCPYK
ncbi:hypothetical protein AVEN_96691-1 [Araneus ventricosus]|uniref:Uncharacterized protein n=1 Tax=Araneus ventricosus TaxID=182803 RepID=A0A4Y2E9V6_ARAVE|nr:hypothetical protein AVEN_96691-1 [Araneus ventricosus]